MARVATAKWTIRLRAVVAELSTHGLSDSDIAVVLDLYEAFTVNESQVTTFRKRCGIEKPQTAVRRAVTYRTGAHQNFNRLRAEHA